MNRILEDLLKGNDEVIKNDYRKKREKILKAFDVYKTNVFYGIETETEVQKQEIIEWYNKILSLEETAINQIPVKVKRYL